MSEFRKDSLYRATGMLCGYCLIGEGDECHTPGCAFFLSRTPDLNTKESWTLTSEYRENMGEIDLSEAHEDER